MRTRWTVWGVYNPVLPAWPDQPKELRVVVVVAYAAALRATELVLEVVVDVPFGDGRHEARHRAKVCLAKGGQVSQQAG